MMKKILLVLVLFIEVIALPVSAQDTAISYWGEPFNMKGTLTSSYKRHKAGTPLTIQGIVFRKENNKKPAILALIDSTQLYVPLRDSYIFAIEPKNAAEFWQSIALKCGMYQYFAKKGYRNSFRKELSNESQDYLTRLKDIDYRDNYVNDFVQSNFAAAYSVSIDPYRAEHLTVRVIASPEPDTFMLPNGTMVVSSGLLCTLDSEDELTAIITNEMCHYLLDHQLDNVVRAEAHSRHAAFWGMFLGQLTNAALDAAINSDHNNNVAAGIAVASGIGTIVSLANVKDVNRLGMNYTLEQDALADSVATCFLQLKGMNVNALPSALYKIRQFYESQNVTKGIPRYVSCKWLTNRLNSLGGCDSVLVSPTYLKATANVVTSNARMYLDDKRYDYAEQLIRKNIKNGLADSQDYVILAQAKMNTTVTNESDEECLKLLDKAQEISTTTNMDIFRPRIQLLMRLSRKDEATNVMQQYADALDNYSKQLRDNQKEAEWVKSEKGWLDSLKQR